MHLLSLLPHRLITTLLALLLALSANAQNFASNKTQQAAEQDSDLFSWVSSYGFSFGGADAVQSQYNPYNDRIETTGMASLSLGGHLRFKHSPLSLQASVSVQFDNVEANKGDANFDYHTFDLLSFYQLERHRLGAGVTYHLNPRFNTALSNGHQMTRFENSFGSMVEYNYQYNQKTAVGLRFTEIKYRPVSSSLRKTLNGKNFAVFIKTFF